MSHTESQLRNKQWVAIVLFGLAVLLVYFPAWCGEPVWDDDAHITRPELRSFEGLKRIWTDLNATQQYYPLTHSVFWLEHQLWGDSPLGHHLVNILLHALCALLFFKVLQHFRLTGAWLAAGIFALHPVHVESVAWITELKNTLSGFFYLAAALAYLKFDEGRGGKSAASGIRNDAGFSLSPRAAVAPERRYGAPRRRKARVGRESERGVNSIKNLLSPALSSIFQLEEREKKSSFESATNPLPNTIGGKFYCIALGLFVLGLMSKSIIATLPAALLVLFWWRKGRIDWKQDVVPLVPFFLLGIGAGLFTAWVERTYIGATGNEFNYSFLERCLIAGRVIWFYLGKLLIPVNLTFIYPRWEISAQVWWQFLFPLAALMMVIILWLYCRRARGLLAAVLLFVGTLFPVLGFLNVYPFRYSFVADHFQYLASLSIIVLFSQGIVFLLERWGIPKPLRCGGVLILLAGLAAGTWNQSRHYASEEKLWADTLEKNPRCALAYLNWGALLLEKQRKPFEALGYFQKAQLLSPHSAEITVNLGLALAAVGKTQQAVAQYRRALELDPDHSGALNNLAWMFATDRSLASNPENAAEAVKLAERACQLTGYANSSTLGTLAAAYANKGEFSKARETAEKAYQLALSASQADVAAINLKALGFYRKDQPFREQTH